MIGKLASSLRLRSAGISAEPIALIAVGIASSRALAILTQVARRAPSEPFPICGHPSASGWSCSLHCLACSAFVMSVAAMAALSPALRASSGEIAD